LQVQWFVVFAYLARSCPNITNRTSGSAKAGVFAGSWRNWLEDRPAV
jgi:hypothetical protein